MRLRAGGRSLGLGAAAGSFLLLFLSCATGSGGTYSSSLEADRSAAARSAAAKAESSRPPAAEEEEESDGGGLFIFAPPPAPTGTLLLGELPPGSLVYVDGSFRFGRSLVLELGAHEILVEAFGFREWSASVYITENALLRLEPDLSPAEFALSGLRAEPPVFDPANPGRAGTATIAFEASGPGSFSLRLSDAAGRHLRSYEGRPILQRSIRLAWDGLDEEGEGLPPGEYQAELFARGEDGLEDSARLRLRIAAGGPLRYWLPLSGLSGPLLAPDARSLAPGRFQAGSALLAHLAAPEEGLASTIPFSAGFRFGLSERSELAGTALSVLRTGSLEDISTSWFAGTLSWKCGLGEAEEGAEERPWAAAIALKAGFRSFYDEDIAFYPPSWDGPTDFGGLSAALPIEWSGGRSRAFLAPELVLSAFYPGWDKGPWAVTGLFSWLYLRLGAEARLDRDLVFAVSAALRTEPFGLSAFPAFDFPLSAAAELHWYRPEGLVLSAYALAELGGPVSYAVYGGLGIGFAY